MDSETDLLILKKIKSSDLNFSSNESENSFNYVSDQDNNTTKINHKDEFKARIFAFIFKNVKSKSLQYKPIGVNIDEEKIPNWKTFLVLMDYIKDSINHSNLTSEKKIDTKNFSDHKLLKVCFPENDKKNFFAIIINFDKSCLDFINFAESVNLLSDEETTQMDRIRKYQNFLLDSNLRKSLYDENKIYDKDNDNKHSNYAGSFIEKSQDIVNNNNVNDNIQVIEDNEKSVNDGKKEGKAIGFETLVPKFSVEELNKIKSLIKFAKKNKIMDHIYEKKGDLSLNDLLYTNNSTNTQISLEKDIQKINILSKLNFYIFIIKSNSVSFWEIKFLITSVTWGIIVQVSPK